MADRTYFQLVVADCPRHQAQTVLDIIDEFDLGLDSCGDITELALGEAYTANEIRCGSTEEIAEQLAETAPNASWECWEDPKYEWLGALVRFTPNLGLFTHDCDADGLARFTPKEVASLAVLPDTVDEPARARELGELHREALDRFIEMNRGLSVYPTDPGVTR